MDKHEFNGMLHTMMDNMMSDIEYANEENGEKIRNIESRVLSIEKKMDMILNVLNALYQNANTNQYHDCDNHDAHSAHSQSLSDLTYTQSYMSLDTQQSHVECTIDQSIILHGSILKDIVIINRSLFCVMNDCIDKYDIMSNGNVALSNDGCKHWMISRNIEDTNYNIYGVHSVNVNEDGTYNFEYVLNPSRKVEFVWNNNSWSNFECHNRFIVYCSKAHSFIEYSFIRKNPTILYSFDISQRDEKTPIHAYNEFWFCFVFNHSLYIQDRHCKLNVISLSDESTVDAMKVIDDVCVICKRTSDNKNDTFELIHISLDTCVKKETRMNFIQTPCDTLMWNASIEYHGSNKNRKLVFSVCSHPSKGYISKHNIYKDSVLSALHIECTDIVNDQSMDIHKNTSHALIDRLFASADGIYTSKSLYSQYVIHAKLENNALSCFQYSELNDFYPIIAYSNICSSKYIFYSFFSSYTADSLLSTNDPISEQYMFVTKLTKWNSL